MAVRAITQRGLACLGLLLPFLLAGCEESNTYVAPPPPKVTVAEPLIRDTVDYLEFTGTTVSSGRVDVRARIPGVLQEMHFEPGTWVKAGDLLFTIDPLEYETAVKVAEADVVKAEARQVEAGKSLERAQTLIKRGNISKAALDEAEANFKTAEAAVLAAKSMLRRADIDLGYTNVTAPIAGRIGRNRVDVGNLVGEEEATVLTDITAFRPMYVYFAINERDLLRILEVYRQRVRERGIDTTKETAQEAEIVLELGLTNEDGFPHTGLLDHSESGVDPATGTVQVRGIFANEYQPPLLLPGLFARVRMPIDARPDMPLVTERAIAADQKGLFVLVVNDENTVEKRFVRIGQLVDGLRVIEEGLTAGEQVIVNGIQRARPGGTVDPEMTDMSLLTASGRRDAAAAATN